MMKLVQPPLQGQYTRRLAVGRRWALTCASVSATDEEDGDDEDGWGEGFPFRMLAWAVSVPSAASAGLAPPPASESAPSGFGGVADGVMAPLDLATDARE
jgi:hypothetical protein